MKPYEPEQIEVRVSKIKKIKFEKGIKGERDEDGYLQFISESGCFIIKVKDLFSNEDWKKILLKDTPSYVAIHGGIGRPFLKIDVWHKKEWECIWKASNDFDTAAERKKSEDGYCAFIEDEAKKITSWIDKGKSLKEIDKLISNDHTGNTFGCALNIGIHEAKNKKNAENVRKAHNKEYGISEEKKGVVNPAILTIKRR